MKTLQLGLSVFFSIFLLSSSMLATPQQSVITQANTDRLAAEKAVAEAEKLTQEGQGTAVSKRLAIEKYLEALQIYKNLPASEASAREVRLQLAAILKKIGRLYQSLGEAEQALVYYNQAVPIFAELGEVLLQARTLHDLGMLYNVFGERQKVLDYLEAAQRLYQQVGDTAGVGLTFSNMGWIHYFFLGARQKGIELYEQALKVYQKAGDRRGESVTLSLLAWAYYGLGNNEQALNYYKQAIEVARQVGYKSGEARASIYISQVYEALGKKQQALDALMTAEKLYQELGNSLELARVYRHLGEVYWEFEELQKALRFYEKSVSIYRELGERIDEGIVLSEMGRLYNSMDKPQQALDTLNQSLSVTKATRDRYGEADNLYEIARIEGAQNNLAESLIKMESSIKITEDLRTSVSSQNLRTSFFSMREDRYEFYIDLLMKLHKNNPSAGYDAKALHASERSRARSLLELLAEAKADIRSSANTELLERESAIGKQINELEKRQVELLDSQPTPEQITALETELFKLYQQYEEIKAEIKATSPSYAAITQPQPLTLSEIQSTLLDENTILLEYSLGEERSYLWAVTKTSINSYELPKQADIEKAVQRFQQEELVPIRMRPAQGVLAVDILSQILLKPVAKQLENKRLAIVADGRLQTIPFSALVIPRESQTQNTFVPLMMQHEIVNLPSASTLAVLRNQVRGRQLAPKTIAVLADPVFGKNDGRLDRNTVNSNNDIIPNLENLPITQVELKDALRDAGIKLTRLSGTRIEAEAIMALVPEAERIQFLDFQANKTSAINPNLAQYRIIHFATHGILNTARPELSGIVMSLVDEQGIPQNGFLRLSDIFNLHLPAELVVLSACQTGQGQEVKGEGIIGLTRGFMYAGAARVLVSLWKVDDQATAELMKRFYRGMLQEKLTPAAALRQAQVEMSQIPQWSSPYYWAAFVLQGEWL
ncbi:MULTISPECIES: CHAT domain-containing protein [Kamptonema]|uniref:CHAT domain-containing protein n=1 Tax=Kamptonema TaxID=1501433 RepID=UPI0003466B9C|nr:MULTISPECIES: CHAT domain-containing tetratricopeptide repeat protein [Kamptonema]